MARRIKLDFSQTKERSDWNTKQMPEGLYSAEIVAVQETKAKDGTAMLIYGFRPTNPKYKTRNFPYYCKLQANQLWKLRDLFVAAGVDVPKKQVTIDPKKVVGKVVAIEVVDDIYKGVTRSSLENIYDISLVDEDSLDSSDDSDDEDFDEEDFEDSLDSDEEEDGDLDSGFDEEDLDDDFDDVEEEEPAPKKKSKKKK